jgi:hypothetical protein
MEERRDPEAPVLGLAGVPNRDDRVLTPAVVRNRLRELQALCDDEKEALLFVSGLPSQTLTLLRSCRCSRGPHHSDPGIHIAA